MILASVKGRGKAARMTKGKVLVRVPVSSAEKREMAEIARRHGKTLTAWAEAALRAARDRTA